MTDDQDNKKEPIEMVKFLLVCFYVLMGIDLMINDIIEKKAKTADHYIHALIDRIGDMDDFYVSFGLELQAFVISKITDEADARKKNSNP